MNLSEQHDYWNFLVHNWHTAPQHRGITCQQHQTDLDRYAQVISEMKPAWVLQTGIYWGGTALFLSDVMSKANPEGRVMVVDIDLGPCQILTQNIPTDNLSIVGDSATSEEFFNQFTDFANGERGLISLDDLHTREQVAVELEMYAPYADYLVVEDTILDTADGDHAHYQPSNPKQALDAWLASGLNALQFKPDPDPEPTQHVGGWLRRISG